MLCLILVITLPNWERTLHHSMEKLRPRVLKLVSGKAGNVISWASKPAGHEAVLRMMHEHLCGGGSGCKHSPCEPESPRDDGRVWVWEGTLGLSDCFGLWMACACWSKELAIRGQHALLLVLLLGYGHPGEARAGFPRRRLHQRLLTSLMNRDVERRKCLKTGKEERNDPSEIANQRLATDLFGVICVVFVSVTISSVRLQ